MQIKRLIDDVCDALDSRVGEYFLGNLVVSPRSGTEFEVIDGSSG